MSAILELCMDSPSIKGSLHRSKKYPRGLPQDNSQAVTPTIIAENVLFDLLGI